MVAETGSEAWRAGQAGEGADEPLMQVQTLLQLASPDRVRTQGRGPPQPRFPRVKRQNHPNSLRDSGGVGQPSVG